MDTNDEGDGDSGGSVRPGKTSIRAAVTLAVCAPRTWLAASTGTCTEVPSTSRVPTLGLFFSKRGKFKVICLLFPKNRWFCLTLDVFSVDPEVKRLIALPFKQKCDFFWHYVRR